MNPPQLQLHSYRMLHLHASYLDIVQQEANQKQKQPRHQQLNSSFSICASESTTIYHPLPPVLLSAWAKQRTIRGSSHGQGQRGGVVQQSCSSSRGASTTWTS